MKGWKWHKKMTRFEPAFLREHHGSYALWNINHVLVITFCLFSDWPEWDVVAVKHLSHADQLCRVLMGWIQNHHLSERHTQFRNDLQNSDLCGFTLWTVINVWKKLSYLPSNCHTYQIMKVFPDLSNDSWKGGPQQLLHIVGPGCISAICLQVINPLEKKKKMVYSLFSLLENRFTKNNKHVAHVNSRVADVHCVVRIWGLDVKLEDVVDVRSVYEQTT